MTGPGKGNGLGSVFQYSRGQDAPSLTLYKRSKSTSKVNPDNHFTAMTIV